MLVSVIVPVFNSESFITETMDSVIKQTWKHLEIIVVDDGSTDRSLYVLQQYRDPRIKVFKQNNKGACAARNLGLQYSSGNVVQFLDADDILAPDKIEHQVKRLLSFDDYNDKIIHSQWGRFYKSIDENIKWEPREAIRKDLNPADWLIADQMSNTHCWLVPRKLIELGGFWDESLERNQDGEFFSRLISNAQDVLFCSEAKVYYRSGLASSIASKNSKSAATSALKAIDLIKEYILNLENSERAKLSMANKFKDFAFANYLMYPDLADIAEEKAAELGGANNKLQGGFTLEILEKLLGWKRALKVKAMIKQFI